MKTMSILVRNQKDRMKRFNSPCILSCLSAHRRATYCVLPAGLARGHRGNPAASVRVERLYGIPVLLSGLDCLVLSTQEVGVLAGHLKQHIQQLLKLHRATPESVVWFLAGCLPFEALLHLRMFSIFEMLARLNGGDNILANYARDALASAKPSSKSWFLEFQRISLRYEISPPPPITFLQNPPSKTSFKEIVQSAVFDFWEKKHRGQALSLKYFNPDFMSLTINH